MQVRLFGELQAEHAGSLVPVRGAASAALGEALGLRRGEPLADFTYAGF